VVDDVEMEPVDAQVNLRYLLNEWDPIGVADVGNDEYDVAYCPVPADA
jgi:hypothetical protein